MSMINWKAVEKEVTRYLQGLIRLDTTNPPGNETLAANYLAELFWREGLKPQVTESEPGRGNVTVRIPGGSEPPFMLLGHTDVVAAEPEKWTHPPFEGGLYDGYVWGRGTLDMKDMVAAELMVILLLKRQGVFLNRDLIFAATADEEAGKGNHGIGWLLDNHPDQVDAPFVLTEGGGTNFRVGERRFYGCQTGQKGIFRFRLKAVGKPGHGSMPHGENALVHLCKVVSELGKAEFPLHMSGTLEAFLDGIAKTQDLETATLFRDVSHSERGEAALKALPVEKEMVSRLRSLLRNTVSPTMLQAGSKINVIPSEATAWLDGRLVPGQTKESFLAEIRPYLGESVEVEVDQYNPALETGTDSPLYQVIIDVMEKHDPEAVVLPEIITGGTDAKHICPRRMGTQVFGFMPRCQVGEGEMNMIHGTDERISVKNLNFATRVIYDIVCRFCGIG